MYINQQINILLLYPNIRKPQHKNRVALTDYGEQHIVEQQRNGDDDEHQLARSAPTHHP